MNIKVKDWKCKGERLVADCRVFKVKAKTFVHPDGRSGEFFVNESADWVQTAALVRDVKSGKTKTILVEQFRFGTQKTSWEFPGGVMEKGETPLEAAARELLEETGYAGKKAKLAASYSPNPAIQSNLAHFVIIDDCEKIAGVNWDENEELKTKIVDIDKLDSMVKSGKIYHSIAINSIYFLQKYLLPTKKKSKKSDSK